MNKKNISKILIFLATTSLGVAKTYGNAEVGQPLLTGVQPAVSITKEVTSIEDGTVSALDGVHTGLHTTFKLQTNGTDANYDFVIKSKVLVDGGEISAYGDQGNLVFVHTLNSPTLDAIENAKIGGKNNKNVIAYPTSVDVIKPMTSNYTPNYSKHGDCYVIKVNNSTEGTVTHNVSATPVNGTYSIAQDQSGTYQAIITFTAISK